MSISSAIGNYSSRQDTYMPPINFGYVESGVYRSGYPNANSFPFLQKLGIKTIVYISCYPKYSQYREENKKYIEETGTEFIFCNAGQNKEPFKQMSTDNISMALKAILDKRKHPILVHCLEGDFGTACVIGCLRKLQNWSLTNVYSEYQEYCKKMNDLDLQFITLFQPTCTFERKYLPDWIDQLRRPILYYISDKDEETEKDDVLDPECSD